MFFLGLCQKIKCGSPLEKCIGNTTHAQCVCKDGYYKVNTTLCESKSPFFQVWLFTNILLDLESEASSQTLHTNVIYTAKMGNFVTLWSFLVDIVRYVLQKHTRLRLGQSENIIIDGGSVLYAYDG